MTTPLLDRLMNALRCLPGVGPKTAQRMAFHLLERARDNALHLSTTLQQAMQLIRHCDQCRTFSETPLCQLCRDPARDASLLCVVESPIDVAAIEQMGGFRGLYFVLMGHLSPLDGIGPTDIGMPLLEPRLNSGKLREVILATNPTVEGEATAHYISTLAKRAGCHATRIAYGVPMGGELEYLDGGTLARAFAGRGEA